MGTKIFLLRSNVITRLLFVYILLICCFSASAQIELTADINGDQIVDEEDLDLLVGHMGTIRGHNKYDLLSDLNADGNINYKDIMLFMNKWHTTPAPRSTTTSETLIENIGIKNLIDKTIEMRCIPETTLLENGLEVVSASETEYQEQPVLPLTIKGKSENDFSCSLLLTTTGEISIPQIEFVSPVIEKFGLVNVEKKCTIQFPSPLRIAGENIYSGSPIINCGTTTIILKTKVGQTWELFSEETETGYTCSSTWIDCSTDGDWSQILMLWIFGFTSVSQHNGEVLFTGQRVHSAEYIYETTDEYTALSFETVSEDEANPGDLLHYFENPTPSNGDHFGWEIGTYNNLIIVGNPFDDDDTGLENGAVYLFDSQTGEHLETLSNKFPNDNSNLNYGFGNAVGTIDNYILASNYNHEVDELPQGAIYIYNGDINSVTFSQYVNKIDNPSPTGNPPRMGQVDIAVNGNVVATHAGNTVYFFQYIPEEQFFSSTPTIITDPNPDTTSSFGERMKAAGPNMLISSAYHNFNSVQSVGIVYIYDCDPSSQTYGTLLKTINNPNPNPVDYETFGVDLAYIDNYIAISAPGHDPDGGHYKGTVYIFDGDPNSPTYGDLIKTIRNTEDTTISYSGFGYALTGIGNYIAASDPSQKNIYFFEPSTGNLVLTIDSPLDEYYGKFGSKLDTVNGNLVVADYEYNTGVVYLFNGME